LPILRCRSFFCIGAELFRLVPIAADSRFLCFPANAIQQGQGNSFAGMLCFGNADTACIPDGGAAQLAF